MLKRWQKFAWILLITNALFVFSNGFIVFNIAYLCTMWAIAIILLVDIIKGVKKDYKKINTYRWYKNESVRDICKLMWILIIPSIFLYQGELAFAYGAEWNFGMAWIWTVSAHLATGFITLMVLISITVSVRKLMKAAIAGIKNACAYIENMQQNKGQEAATTNSSLFAFVIAFCNANWDKRNWSNRY